MDFFRQARLEDEKQHRDNDDEQRRNQGIGSLAR